MFTLPSAVDNICPIVFTVDETEIKLGGDIDTTAELEIAVENAIKKAIAGDVSGTGKYNANVAVPTTANEVLIDWKWAFEGNDDDKDTILGNETTDKATIGFSLTVTVEQVDTI